MNLWATSLAQTQLDNAKQIDTRSQQVQKDIAIPAAALRDVKENIKQATSTTVSNWTELKQALADRSIKNIRLTGNIVLNDPLNSITNSEEDLALAQEMAPITSSASDNFFNFAKPVYGNNRQVTIDGVHHSILVGKNVAALKLAGNDWRLTLKNAQLTTANQVGLFDLSATEGRNALTFENITATGSTLYNGGGITDVYIKGKVFSLVDDSAPQGTMLQQDFPASNDESRRVPNIFAANVYLEPNAQLDIERLVNGDGINLLDGNVPKLHSRVKKVTGNGMLELAENARLTITLNEDEATDINTAVRVNDTGALIKDKSAEINLNVGQGKSIVMNSVKEQTGEGSYLNRQHNQGWIIGLAGLK